LTSPFVQLPAAVRARLGELDGDWADEPRSDCSACPLVVAGDAGVPYPFSMARDARCCTAQPQLANFLVGRVADTAVIRARIANRDGVSAWGIRATAGYDDAFAERAQAGFGRDVTMRCHYWVGGDHACGVWAGRSARCRAFFCRHEHGLAGALSWSQAAGLGVAIESAIADHLVAALGGVADHATDDDLVAWFARCAAAADVLDDAAALAIVRRVPPADAVAPVDRIVHSQRGRLITRLRVHRPALASVLVPAISAVQRDGDTVLLAGYSTFDAVRAPASVFAFLAKLDGTTPWRAALGGDIDEALVRELHRVGALRDPAGSDDPPETE
jgi:hypothetical protein